LHSANKAVNRQQEAGIPAEFNRTYGKVKTITRTRNTEKGGAACSN